MFLGWATNNYWETNFPGMQPGTVTARYVIRPYAGDFDESRAHRLASESEHSRPLVQHLGETAVGGGLPATGMLLHLPQLPILTLNMRADSNSVFLTLYNASDESQTAAIQSGLLSIVHAADCSLFGETQEPLEVKDGVVSVQVPRRSLKVIELKDVRLKFITQWS
jgi:hypothetical protein